MGAFDVLKVPDILSMIVNHNSAGLWAMLNNIMESGVEAEPLFDAISNIVNNLMTLFLGGQVANPDLYTPFMQHFAPARIIYLCNSLFKRSRDLYASSNKKMVIQVLAMELCG